MVLSVVGIVPFAFILDYAFTYLLHLVAPDAPRLLYRCLALAVGIGVAAVALIDAGGPPTPNAPRRNAFVRFILSVPHILHEIATQQVNREIPREVELLAGQLHRKHPKEIARAFEYHAREIAASYSGAARSIPEREKAVTIVDVRDGLRKAHYLLEYLHCGQCMALVEHLREDPLSYFRTWPVDQADRRQGPGTNHHRRQLERPETRQYIRAAYRGPKDSRSPAPA
jgi:hypothetical protein